MGRCNVAGLQLAGVLVKVRGIGGWPSWWSEVPEIARGHQFWQALGFNGYRPMVANDFEPQEVFEHASSWLQAGIHVRVAVNWGRNPPMPDYRACLFERNRKAIDAFSDRLISLAALMRKTSLNFSFEPCQESDVWQGKYGLDQEKWPDAIGDWWYFALSVHERVREASSVVLDLGSCANQSVSGFDQPWASLASNWFSKLRGVRSDAHFYAPKGVAFDGHLAYPSRFVKPVTGAALGPYDEAVTMKETGNFGPRPLGLAYALGFYGANAKRIGVPAGVGEVGSFNRQHRLDLFKACSKIESVFAWDWRDLFRDGILDAEAVARLIG